MDDKLEGENHPKNSQESDTEQSEIPGQQTDIPEDKNGSSSTDVHKYFELNVEDIRRCREYLSYKYDIRSDHFSLFYVKDATSQGNCNGKQNHPGSSTENSVTVDSLNYSFSNLELKNIQRNVPVVLKDNVSNHEPETFDLSVVIKDSVPNSKTETSQGLLCLLKQSAAARSASLLKIRKKIKRFLVLHTRKTYGGFRNDRNVTENRKQTEPSEDGNRNGTLQNAHPHCSTDEKNSKPPCRESVKSFTGTCPRKAPGSKRKMIAAEEKVLERGSTKRHKKRHGSAPPRPVHRDDDGEERPKRRKVSDDRNPNSSSRNAEHHSSSITPESKNHDPLHSSSLSTSHDGDPRSRSKIRTGSKRGHSKRCTKHSKSRTCSKHGRAARRTRHRQVSPPSPSPERFSEPLSKDDYDPDNEAGYSDRRMGHRKRHEMSGYGRHVPFESPYMDRLDHYNPTPLAYLPDPRRMDCRCRRRRRPLEAEEMFSKREYFRWRQEQMREASASYMRFLESRAWHRYEACGGYGEGFDYMGHYRTRPSGYERNAPLKNAILRYTNNDRYFKNYKPRAPATADPSQSGSGLTAAGDVRSRRPSGDESGFTAVEEKKEMCSEDDEADATRPTTQEDGESAPEASPVQGITEKAMEEIIEMLAEYKNAERMAKSPKVPAEDAFDLRNVLNRKRREQEINFVNSPP